jgi:tight adherence protein C
MGDAAWTLWKLLIVLMMGGGVYLLVMELYPDVQAKMIKDRLVQKIDQTKIQSPILKVLFPVWDLYAKSFERFPLKEYRENVQRSLVQAGLTEQMTVNHFLAGKAFFAILIPLFLALAMQTFRSPLGFLLGAVLGFFFADFWVKSMVKDRQSRILRALPLSVDLLTLTVEAGLDFAGGIQRVVEKGPPGPLQEELSKLLQEIRLGTTRANALRALDKRVGLMEITSFTAVLIQADQLGASVGPVLRMQADRMRSERFTRAEKKGAEAASKMIFPMIVFIMPATFIVLIGPLILKFIFNPAGR